MKKRCTSVVTRLCSSGFTPVMTVVCLSVTELRCPGNDWYEFGEFCYKPFSERKTWGAARDDCFYRGGDLVSIHSQEEEEFLSTYSKGTSKWIGLKHNPTEGGGFDSHVSQITLDDGTPLSHTNWADGEPNNHEGREECVEMVIGFKPVHPSVSKEQKRLPLWPIVHSTSCNWSCSSPSICHYTHCSAEGWTKIYILF
uniref:C-type lectin domain-containing protein n=1 Tax=Salarias fasciatus TaxID=181472 RepID=A0A672JAV4_SALFA